jgi:hypothetical protein
MRRPIEEHQVESWQVHDRARGFELLDVWRFPIRISPEIPLKTFLDFRTQLLADFTRQRSLVGGLFALRSWLGQVFGWDGGRENSEAGAAGEASMPFEPVYRDAEEELLEIENATVHAFMHIGRVVLDAQGDGEPRGEWSPQMGVYVKRKGLLGRIYMAAIAPFRHWIVYPSMMRAVAREWPAYLAKHS